MIVQRIFNNSVVSAQDADGSEVILLGKGIGFNARHGDVLRDESIEKTFHLRDSAMNDRFRDVVATISADVLHVTDDIVRLARASLDRTLSDSIYISLADHLSFARQRMETGMLLRNPLTVEVRTFYRDEYAVATQAMGLLKEQLGIDFPEEETTNVALHFVNAEIGDSFSDVGAMMELTRGVASIIKYHFALEYDEESIRYFRFITHVKFFCQRVVLGETTDRDDESLYDFIKDKYPEILRCIDKVDHYVQRTHGYSMSHSEQLYLALHIERML
ncbi:MAG TPA: PRD domain-containing protein [Lacisediminihabitans sp.]|uniref:BglG family transcription antiterminator LicT n=1 Tax=Lacisediminihabitans sp. TaxID=2787631 RepID=UPI002EDA7B29